MLVKSLQAENSGRLFSVQREIFLPSLSSPVALSETRPQESSGGLALGYLIQGQAGTFDGALNLLTSFFFK